MKQTLCDKCGKRMYLSDSDGQAFPTKRHARFRSFGGWIDHWVDFTIVVKKGCDTDDVCDGCLAALFEEAE